MAQPILFQERRVLLQLGDVAGTSGELEGLDRKDKFVVIKVSLLGGRHCWFSCGVRAVSVAVRKECCQCG